MTKHLAIYQNKNGVIELKTDLDADTIWTIETLKKTPQMAIQSIQTVWSKIIRHL